MRIDLAYKPRNWQAQVHKRPERFQVLALHRRAGKTLLAIMRLVDAALRSNLPLPVFCYIAPFLKQAKAIAWSILKHATAPLVLAGHLEVNEGELYLRFRHNGAVIRLFGADNPEALRGMRLDGVVLDEVAQIAPNVWEEILQPALSDRRGWAMFIGTPHGVNLFSQLFYKAETGGDWFAGRWTVYDTQAIDPSEVERLRRDMSEQAFAREYLCDFAAAGDDQLISLTDVETAAQRRYTDADTQFAPKIVGVDAARFGDDRSVIARRHGLVALEPLVYRGLDNMELAARVLHVMEDFKPDAVFVDSGGGAGVIDRLRQLGRNVIEVPFGGKATQERTYLNRRTEMWCEMADWIRAGGQIPNRITLKQELATPVYWYDPHGRKVLEPKEKIKERLQGGASPDEADGLALTFAHPVKVRTKIEQFAHERGIGKSKRGEYDPYSLR